MASANDAMVAMAERIAGTEEEFVKQMNDKAKELGMSYGHYSTLFAQGKVDPPDER